jgi:integrase
VAHQGDPINQIAQRHDLVESRMRANAHVRFGGQAEETDATKNAHRASARPDHTHTSIALKAGVPVKVITERLGHESPAFTLKQYAHVIPGMQADAARTVASTIRHATPRSDDRPQTTRLTFDTGLS